MRAWPTVPLREVLTLDLHKEQIDPSKKYNMVGVLSFGRGLFRRPPVENGATSYKHMLLLKAEHIVMSQLFRWEGALALSSAEFEDSYLSPNFPTFVADESRLDRRFLGWVMQRPSFWADLGSRAKGMGDRRRTLNPDALFQSTTPLPPLAEQQALVARLDALAEKTRQVEAHLDAAERDAEHLLALRFRDAIADVPLRPMSEVVPLVRREVSIDPEQNYTELGVRSFYKGTFHRRTVLGTEFSWQNLYRVQVGDLIFSNIMAWEQAIAIAIAIAKQEDDGCVGNHRMLTCETKVEHAVSGFLWYYFTTQDGFDKVYAAPPGTAARNRTITAPALMAIEVPIPSLPVQQSFDRLQAEVAALKAKHAAIRTANAALLLATLERVFSNQIQ